MEATAAQLKKEGWLKGRRPIVIMVKQTEEEAVKAAVKKAEAQKASCSPETATMVTRVRAAIAKAAAERKAAPPEDGITAVTILGWRGMSGTEQKRRMKEMGAKQKAVDIAVARSKEEKTQGALEEAFALKEEYSAWLLEGNKKITSGARCFIQGTIVKITDQRYDWRSSEERRGFAARRYVVVDMDPGSEYWVQELGNETADILKRHSKDMYEVEDKEYEGMASEQAGRIFAIGEGKTTSKKTKKKNKKK